MKHKLTINGAGDLRIDDRFMYTINRAKQYTDLGIPLSTELIVSNKKLRKSNKLYMTHIMGLPMYTIPTSSAILEFCSSSLIGLFKEIPSTIYWKLA